ncbi:hypothetical protein LTR56_017686 [Elasticomyces elasticus]|nr:hypothetical protein LTR56_017686 [Elasticomyces elasticus]KAK3643787.1 hypothetical protein LTR22_015523 [Elasticomyces elasticus]KAK4912993.1 hypothetical protein LTR49_018640 [Elasticomyces elasticus]KAK5752400.1 hypothetical protein LTS12_017531 [Elasticomyces elasticus]
MEGSEHLAALKFDIQMLTRLHQTISPEDLATGSNEMFLDILSIKHFELKAFNTLVPCEWTRPERTEGYLEEGHKKYLRLQGLI